MRSLCWVVLASFLGTALPARAAETEEAKDPNKERLGVRAGYVGTTSNLDGSFGGGMELALHWTQRIKFPLSADVSMGAFYLGATSRDDITMSAFGGQTFDKVSMRVVHVTVAPMLEFSADERTHLFLSAGAGFYTVSLLIDQALSEADLSNNNWGVTVGTGAIRQVSDSWFIDLGATIHKFWTSDDADDWFFVYSEGDAHPLFYTVTLGFMLRL
jgi:opacity protein-like surface antigen